MVIKDIDRPDKNFKLLIEEQRVGDILYSIEFVYAPSIESHSSRISIAKIDENSFIQYRTDHGLNLEDGKISSYYIVSDKKRSSHDSKYLEDSMGYYDEVMSSFDELISSGKSEFTPKALIILNDVKNHCNEVGKSKNAL